MAEEQRVFTRVAVQLLVETSAGENSISVFGKARDISLQGIFVRGATGIQKGNPCRVEVMLGEPGKEVRIRASGVVFRVEAAG
ncbi:PilZ domain-containing protein, partial [Elusimicrobiota bacterium]